MLGSHEGTLARLTHAELNDSQAASPTSFFLSSVWMSGFGLAAANNTIFFSTGNSDCNIHAKPEKCPSRSTYDGVTNVQESVVGIDQTLSVRKGVFTATYLRWTLRMRTWALGASCSCRRLAMVRHSRRSSRRTAVSGF